MRDESEARATIVSLARSLFERGYSVGSAGNISVRLGEGFLMTPTNSCLGRLDPDRLSRLDGDGRLLDGDPPTKELPLHFSYYRARPRAGAVVHLHSTYAMALSCLADTDPDDAIPAITPYIVMLVGRVPVIPYTMPGSSAIEPLITAKAPDHAAVLLANHGTVVAAETLEKTVFAAEELEEAARLVFLTRGLPVRQLTDQQIAGLQARFGGR